MPNFTIYDFIAGSFSYAILRSNVLAKIKASTHFGSIYLLCISCYQEFIIEIMNSCRYGYDNQKSQIFILRKFV